MTSPQPTLAPDRLRELHMLLWLYEAYNGPVCGVAVLRKHVLEEMRKLAPLAPALALLLFMAPAIAQTNHDRHHGHYQNWTNQRDKGCCNDNDCGELAEENERTVSGGGLEVRIEGEWCPVQAFHYLKRGNAPNWASSHVCVLKKFDGYTQNHAAVCDRLLCYQPKPGI